MSGKLRTRLHHDDRGFTLIELMVVVLIIAILIAVAIPTFLGAQDRARDRGAQSNLRNALAAAKTISTDNAGQFIGVTVSSLTVAESALTFVDGGAPVAGQVHVSGGGTGAPAYVFLYTKSASGMGFGIATNQKGDVRYCKGVGDTPPTVGVDASGALTGCTDTEW